MIETNWCNENRQEDEDWNYRTGHLWDIVFVLYNCVQTAIVILKNDTWRDLIKKIFCNAQDISYCNFDHISSNSFYLCFFNLACLYLLVVMWGGYLSIKLDIKMVEVRRLCLYVCQHTCCLKDYRILVSISLILQSTAWANTESSAIGSG